MFLPVRLALLTNQSACATASPGALDGSAKWYAPNARPAASASCLFVSYLGSRKVVPWVTLAITKRVPPCLTLFQSMAPPGVLSLLWCETSIPGSVDCAAAAGCDQGHQTKRGHGHGHEPRSAKTGTHGTLPHRHGSAKFDRRGQSKQRSHAYIDWYVHTLSRRLSMFLFNRDKSKLPTSESALARSERVDPARSQTASRSRHAHCRPVPRGIRGRRVRAWMLLGRGEDLLGAARRMDDRSRLSGRYHAESHVQGVVHRPDRAR